ncbi:MAG: flavodoxin domain-containing protein [Patescibacteria group bacterium]
MSKRVIIVYASNSGATFLVAEIIARVLKRRYQVTMQKAAATQPVDLEQYDVLLFGSPSWRVPGRGDGFPQETMLDFMRRCAGREFPGQQCAAFGCGDSSYTLFCGAVNQLEKFLFDLKAKRVSDSLRIDGYFFDREKNMALAERWAEELLQKIV